MDYNDYRVLHDYNISVSYGIRTFEGHVIYLRRLTSQYNDKSMDEIDNSFLNGIDAMGYTKLIDHNAFLIDDEAKLKEWDDKLKKQNNYIATVWNQFVYSDSFRFPCVLYRQILFATVLSNCDVDIPSFHLLGYMANFDLQTVGNLLNVNQVNPMEMLQQHPCIHSVTCFFNISTNDIIFYYRFNPNNEIVKATYNVNTRQVTICNPQDYGGISNLQNEYDKLGDNKDIFHIALNSQLDAYTKAKDAVLGIIINSKDSKLTVFSEYLSKMQEA